MNKTVFSLTAPQRRAIGIRFLLSVLVLVALSLWGYASHHGDVNFGLPVFDLLALAFLLFSFVLACLSYTAVDEYRLEFRDALFRTQSYLWAEIERIEVGPRTLKVTVDGGKHRHLPAPLDMRKSNTLPDSDFEAKARQILDHWRAHHGGVGMTVAAASVVAAAPAASAVPVVAAVVDTGFEDRQPLEYLVIETSMEQRKVILMAANILAGFAAFILLLAFVGSATPLANFLIFTAAVGAFGFLVAWLLIRGDFTECAEQGILTRRYGRIRACEWVDVEDVTVETRSGENSETLKVRVRPRTEASFTLAAPIHRGGRDKAEFTREVNQVLAFWHAAVKSAEASTRT